MQFSDLGLTPEILRALADQGYSAPTPIQAQAIPAVLSGGDLMACAQTGTGKTAGFTLPILHRLFTRDANTTTTGTQRHKNERRGPQGRPPRVLILTPTRELAAQVEESVKTYGKHLPLKSLVIFGGVGMNPQIAALQRGVDILVATPGRLLDHARQGSLDLSAIEILVLDEADRMLDMGFIHDIRRVLALLPSNRQNLLFSATFSDDIRKLAESFLKAPQHVEAERRNSASELVRQTVFKVDRERKRDLLIELIRTHQWPQVLVFTRTKWGANSLAEKLSKAGIEADAIHGNKSQNARLRALASFKNGTLPVLVATDIAARGIDIEELPYVVNYELPNVPEDYVHRIGRTGRAGSSGEAVSLVCVDENKLLKDIERLLKKSIDIQILPGFEPDPVIKAEPIQMRSNAHQPRPTGRNNNAGRANTPRRPHPESATGTDAGHAARKVPRNSNNGRRQRPPRSSANTGT